MLLLALSSVCLAVPTKSMNVSESKSNSIVKTTHLTLSDTSALPEPEQNEAPEDEFIHEHENNVNPRSFRSDSMYTKQEDILLKLFGSATGGGVVVFIGYIALKCLKFLGCEKKEICSCPICSGPAKPPPNKQTKPLVPPKSNRPQKKPSSGPTAQDWADL